VKSVINLNGSRHGESLTVSGCKKICANPMWLLIDLKAWRTRTAAPPAVTESAQINGIVTHTDYEEWTWATALVHSYETLRAICKYQKWVFLISDGVAFRLGSPTMRYVRPFVPPLPSALATPESCIGIAFTRL
jgi:hypothetical protein